MAITIKLEHIGRNINRHNKYLRMPSPRVAEIRGFGDKFFFDRRFLESNTDYADSGEGNRGTCLVFHLHEARVYEVFDTKTWGFHDRYFCTVKDNKIIRISEEEVIKWLTERKSSASQFMSQQSGE